jgi:hypothetical protein
VACLWPNEGSQTTQIAREWFGHPRNARQECFYPLLLTFFFIRLTAFLKLLINLTETLLNVRLKCYNLITQANITENAIKLLPIWLS